MHLFPPHWLFYLGLVVIVIAIVLATYSKK